MPELHVSLAQHYHDRTKYDPETIAHKGRRIDWSQQPIPFKDYKIGQVYHLRPYLSYNSEGKRLPDPDPRAISRDLARDSTSEAWWRRLSRFLLATYGITAEVTGLDQPLYLRTAPSAGGLYPAEIYLVSRGLPGLPAGLYHYQPLDHSLIRFWDVFAWSDLQSACFWPSMLESLHLALVVTAVFQRSAWRYQDRAYRRICLDTGHLLGNLELAGALNDFRPHLIGGFADPAINQLLYLDETQEGTLVVAGLADLLDAQQNLTPATTALPSPTQTDYKSVPDGDLLGYFHQATQLLPGDALNPSIKIYTGQSDRDDRTDKYNFPFCLKVPTASLPISWGEALTGLEQTILRRRSTRAYTGADLTLDELKAVLNFTYQSQDGVDQGLDQSPDYFALDLVETFVAVSGVSGLDAGCYYYAPAAQELRQIRFKNFRQELHYLCLGQDLGRDAAAVIFHTADLKAAVAQYGDRVYRYLHLDAGHLGQRLNLAAIYLGLGVSGIGGFFDDQVNDILGIPVDEAVLYITTIGRPRSQP